MTSPYLIGGLISLFIYNVVRIICSYFKYIYIFYWNWHFLIGIFEFQMAFLQSRSISLVDMYIDNSEPSENVGQIHFSLEYDFQNTTLILRILTVSSNSDCLRAQIFSDCSSQHLVFVIARFYYIWIVQKYSTPA